MGSELPQTHVQGFMTKGDLTGTSRGLPCTSAAPLCHHNKRTERDWSHVAACTGYTPAPSPPRGGHAPPAVRPVRANSSAHFLASSNCLRALNISRTCEKGPSAKGGP